MQLTTNPDHELDPFFYFEVVNIRLQTNKSPEDRYEAYKSILFNLVKSKIHSAVGENKHMIIYTAILKKTDNNVEYIYGKLGKGIYIEDENINSIDIEKSQTERVSFDTSKIYKPEIADYIFIPSAHRFCVLLGDKISGNDVKKFLYNNIPEIMDKTDKIEVSLENEEKAINEIKSAKQIHKIDYTISYTNDDPLGATASLFDRRLKKSQIGKINVKAEADHNDFLKTKNEELLEGGIELAQSNGSINSADITDNMGIRRTVTSKDKPRKIKIQADYEKFRAVLVAAIIQIFRN